MFSLLFIKYLSLDNRTRRIAGLSVVFVCAIFAGVIFLNVSYFDRLNRYAAQDTYFYLHLNRSHDSFYQIKIIDALLDNYHLANLDRHLLGSELAIICQVRNSHDYCVLVMTAKRPKQLEAYLIANKTPYKQLSHNDFAIASNPDYLISIKKNYNVFLRQRYQSALGKNGQLTVAVANKAGTIGNSSRLLALIDAEKLKLYGHASNLGINLTASALPFMTESPVESFIPPCDIEAVMTGENFNRIISSRIIEKYPAVPKINLATQDSLRYCAVRRQSTGDFFDDFGFNLVINTTPSDSLKLQLDQLVKTVSETISPIEKSFYMGGKDKVTEYYPNNYAGQSAWSTSTAPSLPLALYESSSNEIVISNAETKMTSSVAWPDIFIKSSVLNLRPFNSLLGNFSYFSMHKGTIIIK